MSNLLRKHTHRHTHTASHTVRWQTEACLWGDAAAVTLPLNKHCASSSATLKNNRPHLTYAHTPPQIVKPCTPTTGCARPGLSLSLRDIVSPWLFFSPPLLWKYKVPVSGNLMIKEMWGEGRVCVWKREREREKGMFQIATAKSHSTPECTPISVSLSHKHRERGLCVLWTRTEENKCVIDVRLCSAALAHASAPHGWHATLSWKHDRRELEGAMFCSTPGATGTSCHCEGLSIRGAGPSVFITGRAGDGGAIPRVGVKREEFTDSAQFHALMTSITVKFIC